MKWAAFKQMEVREILEFVDSLAKASSVEDGPAAAGVQWDGAPIEDVAKELVVDFLDAVTPFPEGSMLESVSDMAISMGTAQTDWVDKALGLARFAAPVLSARPLAGLPF